MGPLRVVVPRVRRGPRRPRRRVPGNTEDEEEDVKNQRAEERGPPEPPEEVAPRRPPLDVKP